MATYALVSRWCFEAPVVAIWEALTLAETWPRWWRYVESVELLKRGDGEGCGAVRRFVWTSRLPYRLAFQMRTTRVERLCSIAGAAVGELNGFGRWDLESAGPITSARYTWIVTTERAWMNRLSPLLGPVFRWNHHAVMEEGAGGLARHLGVRLVSAEAGKALHAAPISPSIYR
ncbi:MAG: SRPBCC family protein [Burkholderiales bacterium]